MRRVITGVPSNNVRSCLYMCRLVPISVQLNEYSSFLPYGTPAFILSGCVRDMMFSKGAICTQNVWVSLRDSQLIHEMGMWGKFLQKGIETVRETDFSRPAFTLFAYSNFVCVFNLRLSIGNTVSARLGIVSHSYHKCTKYYAVSVPCYSPVV